MIKLKKIVLFTFARNRIRREIQFDPKLKDFTNQQIIKMQSELLRYQFDQVPDQTFSNVLEDPHPKPTKRFFIDKVSLNKKIRQSYKAGIKRDLLQPHGDDDLDYLSASKSHLNDQTQEIEFERKFKQQLFRSKQTQRLIGKKQKEINNYIQGKQKDIKYLQYEEAKKNLKNKKIGNMMSLNRNNQQLQLLIESGFLNNPSNIKAVIDQLNPSRPEGLLYYQNQEKNGSKDLIQTNSQQKSMADKLEDIGPEELKERQKIVQFMRNYEEQHQKDKLSCRQDLHLLKQIKEYEQEVFLSRYDQVNFRFKGKVNFGFFKENELVSYIKNQSIEPRDLLMMFKQNLNAISKFKVPILTPQVVGTLYSKTSLYKFPQTDRNNRINMLNDKNFQQLQRKVFKDIALINDTDFCSVIWAYSQNHQDEQGILNKKLSNKIVSVIADQLAIRVFNLNDEDLGLAMRAMSKLPLANTQHNWQDTLKHLDSRLPSISNLYALQSVFQFLMTLSESSQIAAIAHQHIQLFGNFKWEQTNTITSFINTAGLVLKEARQQHNLGAIKAIKDILIKAEPQIHQILPRISVNYLPQFLTVFRQTEASLQLPKVVNLAKKLVVENIKTQKQNIKQHSLSNLIGNFALSDIQKYQSIKIRRYEPKDKEKLTMLMRRLCLKQLMPFQAISYNSSHYFVYHELATLTYNQMQNIGSLQLAKILQNLSMVKYKNEKLYDEIVGKILHNIDQFTDDKNKQLQVVTGYSEFSIVKMLMSVCNSYSLQRRTGPLYFDALQMLLGPKYYPVLCQQSPNTLIRLASGVLGLIGDNQISANDYHKINRIATNILIPISNSKALLQQQQAAIVYCTLMLRNYHMLPSLYASVKVTEVDHVPSKFVLGFGQLLMEISKNGQAQHQTSKQFQKLQQQFYKLIIQEILHNQSCIGTALTYTQVHSKVALLIKNKYPHSEVIAKKWSIQVPSHKLVYAIGSYDHFMAKAQSHDKVSILFHGVWKLYQRYYQLKGWTVQKVITFLQGK